MSIQPAGAKDQVARLLTLVPFLHARGAVRLEDAARRSAYPRSRCSPTSRCC